MIQKSLVALKVGAMRDFFHKKCLFTCGFRKMCLPLHTQNKNKCPDGGIGRRALKHQWSNIHPGSTPGLGTKRLT